MDMANEPERIGIRMASLLGGALLWIAVRADHGNPLTSETFVVEYRGPTWDADYGDDVLDQLRRDALIEEGPDGSLSITRKAIDWIDAADFWRHISDLLTRPYSDEHD
jgi:hypothetical protein